jgi:hypothetical protein
MLRRQAAPIALYPYAMCENFFGGGSCIGGGGDGAARINFNLQAMATVQDSVGAL